MAIHHPSSSFDNDSISDRDETSSGRGSKGNEKKETVPKRRGLLGRDLYSGRLD